MSVGIESKKSNIENIEQIVYIVHQQIINALLRCT